MVRVHGPVVLIISKKSAGTDINLRLSGRKIQNMAIERSGLDHLRQLYKEAVEQWIAAIREEENLATQDHSVAAWDVWDLAGFKAEEAGDRVKAAKEAYKDGLRQIDYSI
jgi:hypothetical protein